MIKIDLERAAILINSGNAGFYSYKCQAPIAHPRQMCVFAGGCWWLIGNGELRLIDNGIQVVGATGWARAINLEIDSQHPIVGMLLEDERNHRGPDTPEPIADIYHCMVAQALEPPQRKEGS